MSTPVTTSYDLIILGGGAGGLTIASGAAQLGRRVALIEKKSVLGGDCLHYGCVPSKSFIHAASVAWHMRTAGEVGLDDVNVQPDLTKVNEYVQRVIARIQKNDDPDRFRSYGCDVLFGDPSFVDSHTILCDGKHLKAKRIVIATGASPVVPAIPGLEESGYITNETLFKTTGFPKRFAIIGSGPIGLEIAHAMARFGSKVTVIESKETILPMVDAQIRDQLIDVMNKQGVQFQTSIAVEKIEMPKGKTHAERHIIGKNAVGETVRFIAEGILVATGRKPNLDTLALDKSGVHYSDRGIDVDNRMRTNQKHIYAVGDVQNSRYHFTHMSEYQAGIVIANAVFRVPKKADYRAVPSVIFTQPELAMVGLSASEAKDKGLSTQEVSWPYADIDRALAENAPEGMIKLLLHKQRIVGATILGAHAGELIAEIGLAIQSSLKIGAISGTIHAYPTVAQGNRRAVNQYYATKLFNPKTKCIIRWLNRIFP